MSKIGRNDPCPCGSGKKYKNCCIDLESTAQADLFTRYSQTIAAVKLKLDEAFKSGIKKIRKDAQQNFLRYSVKNQLSADHESLFSDWLWFDMVDSDGDTMARDYLSKHAAFMPAPLLECLTALSTSYLSVYEPMASSADRMDVRDIFSGVENQLILKEALDMDVREKPLLLLGRLVAFPEGNVFSGMVLMIENNDDQQKYIRCHMDYLQALKKETDSISLLKQNADILYGLFDHAYQKKLISINDIRALKLDAENHAAIQAILDDSDHLDFLYALDEVRWYQDPNANAYQRIGLGDDYVLGFVTILEDLNMWDEILGEHLPRIEAWQVVNCRFLRQAPPDALLSIWYKAIRDQETERWLHTPHRELEDKTPLEYLEEKDGLTKVLELLDTFAARLEEGHEGQDLIDYMRRRIQQL